MEKNLIAAIASVLFALGPCAAFAQARSELQIEKPWARATVPGAAVGGGYLVIRNNGATGDRLLGATTPASARVEIHEMAMEKNVMRMREVKGIDVPAKGAIEFKPGGYHLMFMELKAPLKQGEKVPVTLRFEKAGEIKADFSVEPIGASVGHSHSMKH